MGAGVTQPETFNGVYDEDMAQRNFMAQFHPDGRFSRIVQVDFEKTVITDKSVDRKRRGELLSKLEEDIWLTSGERTSPRESFRKGYVGEKK